MNLIDRFRYIMKLNQFTASAFADEIGVQRSSVSHVLSGRNKPSLEFIQKVLTAYPKVDANWLINGTTKVDPKQEAGELAFSEESESPERVSTDTRPQEEGKEKGKEDKSVLETDNQGQIAKKVERIIVFYSDQTFETFNK
jgi:transcriptional regulator with XRE-family HTH domain